MQYKLGVSAGEKHPALRFGLLVMEEESIRVTGRGIVITSLQDGTHSKDSLHYGISYQGRKRLEADDRARAADVRTRDYTEREIKEIQISVDWRLGPDFDLVLESDHWHLEYDPKPLPTRPRLVA